MALSSSLLAELRHYYMEHAQQPEWWQRSLTKQQTVILLWIAGWIAVLAMMALGDYQLTHRAPSLEDLAMYVGIGAVLGPLFALIGAWKAGVFSRKRDKPDGPA